MFTKKYKMFRYFHFSQIRNKTKKSNNKLSLLTIEKYQVLKLITNKFIVKSSKLIQIISNDSSLVYY